MPLRPSLRTFPLSSRAQFLVAVAAAISGAASLCGCAHVDNRTAVELEQAADRRRSSADLARAAVRTQQTTRPVPSGYESGQEADAMVLNAAQGHVAVEEEKAKDEESRAHLLRDAAARACSRVPPAQRVYCPLADQSYEVEAVKYGARIRPHGTVEDLVSSLNCALADARVDFAGDDGVCPLYVPGAVVRVVPGVAPPAFEIVSDDELRGQEIVKRARALLVPAPPPPASAD